MPFERVLMTVDCWVLTPQRLFGVQCWLAGRYSGGQELIAGEVGECLTAWRGWGYE